MPSVLFRGEMTMLHPKVSFEVSSWRLPLGNGRSWRIPLTDTGRWTARCSCGNRPTGDTYMDAKGELADHIYAAHPDYQLVLNDPVPAEDVDEIERAIEFRQGRDVRVYKTFMFAAFSLSIIALLLSLIT